MKPFLLSIFLFSSFVGFGKIVEPPLDSLPLIRCKQPTVEGGLNKSDVVFHGIIVSVDTVMLNDSTNGVVQKDDLGNIQSFGYVPTEYLKMEFVVISMYKSSELFIEKYGTFIDESMSVYSVTVYYDLFPISIFPVPLVFEPIVGQDLLVYGWFNPKIDNQTIVTNGCSRTKIYDSEEENQILTLMK